VAPNFWRIFIMFAVSARAPTRGSLGDRGSAFLFLREVQVVTVVNRQLFSSLSATNAPLTWKDTTSAIDGQLSL
jgi:hypothetical protein